MLGACVGTVCGEVLPLPTDSLWPILGMAAMMAGTMRSPLTAVAFALELTGDFNILPEVLAASCIAHACTVVALKRSILTEKVARRGLHVNREYGLDPFSLIRVEEIMDTEVPLVNEETKLSELFEMITHKDAVISSHQATIIVDAEKKLKGIITRGDIVRTLSEKPDSMDRSVLSAGRQGVIVSYPDEILDQALSKMLLNDIGRLPVVERADPSRVLGYLGRTAMLRARTRSLDEEHRRERFFLN